MSDVKSEDKKDIEVEEREKMLNAENKAQDEPEGAESGSEDKKNTKEIKEGMEVKPKKIPIGGIQMPGFFTRSKSKERCKEDDQNETEGTELIDKSSEKNGETTTSHTRIKLPNPFRKSRLEEEGQKSSEPKEKKKLLDTIRLPLVSVFPKKKKDDNLQSQTVQAGLASMETLDEKSTDGKSVDEKTNELKTVVLDDKTDVEAQDTANKENWFQVIQSHKIAVGASLLFLLVIVIIVILAFSGRQVVYSLPIKDGKFVETVTSCGKVEGVLEDGAIAFRGIPYARPPLGDLRFRTARPLDSIDYCWNGTLGAHNATPVCLQLTGDGKTVGIEDCLTLDVVTPYVRYDNPLPVIVLIGADSLTGGAPGKMRPSARYARYRDVVFVRPNFRLGALGFLALEVLSESDYPHTSGNYGLSDILEALHWVKLNIEHFGGDPTSVTLFGHKAGATLVTALTTIPNAKDYFTRAWATSGGAIYPTKSAKEAEIENRSFMAAVQCNNTDCLKNIEPEKLVNAVEDTWRKPQPDLPMKGEDVDKRHQWLVLDGRILREEPSKVWEREGGLSVKLVIGSTSHSASSEKLFLKHIEWTADLIKKHISQSSLDEKNLTPDVLKMYPHTYQGLSALISDIRTVCPLYNITSRMHRVPFYVATQTRLETNVADIDTDVEAILGRYEPHTPEQRRYVSAMQGLFYHYVWHGRIEEQSGVPDGRRRVLIVGQDVLPNDTYSHCDYWIQKNIVPKYAALD